MCCTVMGPRSGNSQQTSFEKQDYSTATEATTMKLYTSSCGQAFSVQGPGIPWVYDVVLTHYYLAKRDHVKDSTLNLDYTRRRR